jgi:hypothetical protein
MSDVRFQLALADQDWKFGQLVTARAGYASALTLAPQCWHAAFQLAWIDSAFKTLPSERIERLRRSDLPPELREDLYLMLNRTERLSGSLEDWDIKTLQATSNAGDAMWWEARAADASNVDQDGLALACYQMAESLEPQLYFDPPKAMIVLPGRISRHLALLQRV